MPRDEAASKEPEEFVEVDPSRRYGRYADVLGRGAYKIVYKAFDELEGMEVAWNQVKAADVLRKSDNLDRLHSEVHLLQTLKHKNIIKCYSSWVDSKQDNINFITEVFTSGNLREYRNKHKHVNIRALKNWSRQILQGLVYLHSHDPPVIHRDLKCDNIFVNGNQGEVKIGDLGLAAILYQAHAAHSVIGTPEFMAPELYEEEYNELVDIYAFGMCLLELVTFEYPYSECTNAAQIFKKVSSGIKPASLTKVKDPEVKTFIEKCIADVSKRLSARELLDDPFLLTTSETPNSALRLRPRNSHEDGILNLANQNAGPSEPADPSPGTDFKVEGRRKDVHTIFLKLKIPNSSGKNVHDIHFPFHIESDTAINVAREMVSALTLPKQDVMAIASMIDSEIRTHIPNWMSEQTAGNNYSDKVQDQKVGTESKDGILDLPTEPEHSPANFLLDRLPSGHIFWCDSPDEKEEDSSLCLPFSSFVNIDSRSVKVNLSAGEEGTIGKMNDEGTRTVSPQNEQDWEVTLDLEKLLIKQHKELDELHKKHEKAVEVLLRRLPKELRSETLRNCKSKVQTITGVQK